MLLYEKFKKLCEFFGCKTWRLAARSTSPLFFCNMAEDRSTVQPKDSPNPRPAHNRDMFAQLSSDPAYLRVIIDALSESFFHDVALWFRKTLSNIDGRVMTSRI
jgi:hypothetical protein